MAKMRWVWGMSFVALALAAAPAQAQRATRAPTSDPNEGRVRTESMPKQFPLGLSWRAVSVGGKPISGPAPTLQVDQSLRGIGFSGCNSFSATMYPLNQQGFAVGPIAVTQKACDKGVDASEKAFLIALRTAQKWDMVDGRLVLKTGHGDIVFERGI